MRKEYKRNSEIPEWVKRIDEPYSTGAMTDHTDIYGLSNREHETQTVLTEQNLHEYVENGEYVLKYVGEIATWTEYMPTSEIEEHEFYHEAYKRLFAEAMAAVEVLVRKQKNATDFPTASDTKFYDGKKMWGWLLADEAGQAKQPDAKFYNGKKLWVTLDDEVGKTAQPNIKERCKKLKDSISKGKGKQI